MNTMGYIIQLLCIKAKPNSIMTDRNQKPEQPKESYPLRKMKSIVRSTERNVRIVFWLWIAAILVTLAGVIWYSIY